MKHYYNSNDLLHFLLVYIVRLIVLQRVFVVSLFSGMANGAVLQPSSSLVSADAVQLWVVQLVFVAEGNV